MSCWVTPKIAADIWGLPLADILSLIATGRMSSREDCKFRFVQLPAFSNAGQRLPASQRPRTFNPIGSAANLEEDAGGRQIVTPEESEALIADPTESDMGPPPDEDPNDNRIAGWREGRKRASTLRRGPGRPGGQSPAI